MEDSTRQSPIRVAIVEDDVAFQDELVRAVQSASDMALVGVAATRLGGMQIVEGTQVDVLLVDLGLPDGSGIDVIRAAHATRPACDVMVSTAFGDELHVMQSLEAGAAGYLLKDSSPRVIVDEIRSLRAGGSPISPLIARQVLTRFRANCAPATVAPQNGKLSAELSARERQVLEYITMGFTSDEIAALISVSRHTVLTYVRRIYTKLEVNSRIEAINVARDHGLLNG